MHILNLDTQIYLDHFQDNFYNNNNSYLILSTPYELKKLQTILEIDDITFKDCLNFDDSIKLDLFNNYDFLSLNTFELIDGEAVIKEINIYLADNYILVVSDKNHYIYNYVIKLMTGNLVFDKTTFLALFKINYLIFREIIVNEFETLEKIEDMILDMEDKMLEGVEDKHFHEISHIRSLTRNIVKNIRPLLYIGDRILKDNIRYLTYSNIKEYNLDKLQSIDFGIDKLYNFSLSTRELADKLLDIYSSQVAEKTNSLITKLTLLTAISAPLTIITGIYGMNFDFMPELRWQYGYPLALGVMFLIIFISILIFKFKKFL
ncbi:magnesium transporter CorA family protein [Paraclostridium sordellii]|uniref:magnesium transporter CorA family protein n=1 Tax=Paraclostridium sordellii TaxID=1505 RepID=UPI000C75F296|nr:CorA family divalent cation transporter [Paeniclostridium sordellii]AUN14456.1 cation transporter [Paeniclostridium sordellii]